MRTSVGLVALALLLVPLAAADDHDERETDSSNDDWEYKLSVTSNRAVIEMSRETADTERSVEFQYDRDQSSVEFSLESETGDLETEASMEVQFHQLFEFEDRNGNGQYDAGEPIASAFTLSGSSEEKLAEGRSVTWGPISQAPTTSDNGAPGTRFSSTAPIGNGSIRLDFFVFARPATLGPVDIESTELKLDIVIQNYPYQSNTSRLGLFLETESEVEIEDDRDVPQDEEGVVARSPEAELRFAWLDVAVIDGQERPVLTTPLESATSQKPGEYENEELLVFSYARGNSILHDPTMGVLQASGSGGFTPGLEAIAIVAGVGAVALAVRRRRTA